MRRTLMKYENRCQAVFIEETVSNINCNKHCRNSDKPAFPVQQSLQAFDSTEGNEIKGARNATALQSCVLEARGRPGPVENICNAQPQAAGTPSPSLGESPCLRASKRPPTRPPAEGGPGYGRAGHNEIGIWNLSRISALLA